MIYYRCKCGERESWSSIGVPDCTSCSKCGTTLETHFENHTTPQPHEFMIKYNQNTCEPYEICKKCYKTKKQLEAERKK